MISIIKQTQKREAKHLSTESILGLSALVTSLIAAIFGFGGGMLLIAVLPLYLSPSTIIPIHGVTQLASNISRSLFSLKHVQWPLIVPFLIGSILGVGLFGLLLSHLPSKYIPALIGSYIVLNLWSSKFSRLINRYESYYLIGVLQTGLGLVVGATGPIGTSVLAKKLSDHNQLIATSSMFMTISHLLKILVFGFIGFSYTEHLNLLISMVLGSVLGSYLGTKMRRLVGNQRLIWLIKALLTGLALKMIFSVILT
ncbi:MULTISPECIES: sulfite exporter TauE/SafE family protein [unclassified Agarivorans]|uniref:sulfite exporter TauE/SafE family protein n=1 Tax=unclassified Agarivorans TaxID=2636026 RepID=UPI003D7E49DE